MGKANVNLTDVSSFEQAINSQSQQINELCSNLRGKLSNYSEMISKEKQEVNSVIEQITQGLVKLSSKIKELQEELKNLEAQLEATPPTIKEVVTDDEGNETVVEVPNPAYEVLQNKIMEVEKKITYLEQIKDLFDELKNKATEQSNKLNDATNKIEELLEQLNYSVNNLSLVCEEAMSKLKDIQNVIQDYVDTKIESPDLGVFEKGTGGFFQKTFGNLFGGNRNIYDALKKVEHRPIQTSSVSRTQQQIINNISGGDKTDGSCSSLALAYAGNRAGYVVFDFRDGQSRDVFASRSYIEQIANLEGVDSMILRGTDDSICAGKLMSSMKPGREYYMATGSHAAIVRLKDEGGYQYLELQSGISSENGWHSLNESSLCERFRCEDRKIEVSNYLIELDSLQNNSEFLNILGYINTDEHAQVKGADGHER